MDENGHLWETNKKIVYKINVDTNTYEAINFSFTGSIPAISDVVYIQSTNSLWGVANTSNDLYQYDLGNFTITKRIVAGLPTGTAYGAGFTFSDNGLYLGHNKNPGGIYKISDFTTANPTAVFFVGSASTSRNDGASCPVAAPPSVLTSGSISGSVKDPSGNPVVGAQVKIVDSTTGATIDDTNGNPLTVTVDAATGDYSFSDVPTGDYNIVETNPANYTSTGETSDQTGDPANNSVTDDVIPVTVTAGETDSGNDFEDTITASSKDYGDAPITGTAPDGNGTNNYGEASHQIKSGVYLGSSEPDADTVNQPTTNADGDDTDGSNDEDGITLPILTQGETSSVSATVVGSGGYLQGWIDFNGNGIFDGAEQVAANLQDGGVGDTDGSLNGIIAFDVSVPMSAVTAQTYARFRWSTTQSIDATDTSF